MWMHELEIAVLKSRYVSPEGLLDRMDAWFRQHGVSPDDQPELERGSMAMRFFVADL